MFGLLATSAESAESAEKTATGGVDWAQVWDSVWHWCIHDGIKLILALIVLWLTFKITNFIFKRIYRRLEKKKADKTLSRTFVSVGRKVVKFFLLMMFVAYIGIDTSSIIAAVTAGAVTVGLALQGALSNLASGVLIIVLRPFRVGDFIECAGATGTVEDIGLFQTRIVSVDNKVLIVGNSSAVNSTIVNYSMKDTRRVDMVFSIAYENDFRKAKNIIREEIEKSVYALKDPAPFVNIKEHGSSSIDLVVRTWVKSPDYWDFYWSMMEDVKMAFDKNGITIPYSQIDVHMKEKADEQLKLEDDNPYVQAEIAAYKQNVASKSSARTKRIATEKAEKERQENKSLFKKIAKVAKKKENKNKVIKTEQK